MVSSQSGEHSKSLFDNWVNLFPVWHNAIGGMFAGMNWMAPEHDLLLTLREEIMRMVKVIDKRLEELAARQK